jgi:hypothetical protein
MFLVPEDRILPSRFGEWPTPLANGVGEKIANSYNVTSIRL